MKPLIVLAVFLALTNTAAFSEICIWRPAKAQPGSRALSAEPESSHAGTRRPKADSSHDWLSHFLAQ